MQDIIEKLLRINEDDKQDSSKIEDAEEFAQLVGNKIAEAIGDANLGYWFSGERKEGKNVVFEFMSTQAPNIEVKAIFEQD